MEIPATIVSYCNSRELNYERSLDGRIINMEPVPGSDRFSLEVKLSSGKVITVSTSEEDFESFLEVLPTKDRIPAMDLDDPCHGSQ